MPLAFGQLRAFTGMMNDTVSIAPYTGVNRNGEHLYGDAVSYTARVVGKNRHVISRDTEQVLSTATIYLGTIPTVAMSPLDLITLPARFNPRQPPILAIEQTPDDHGIHHVTLAV